MITYIFYSDITKELVSDKDTHDMLIIFNKVTKYILNIYIYNIV